MLFPHNAHGLDRASPSLTRRVSGPASGPSARTGDTRRKGGDIREGNSRTGTTVSDAESYQRDMGGGLIRDPFGRDHLNSNEATHSQG